MKIISESEEKMITGKSYFFVILSVHMFYPSSYPSPLLAQEKRTWNHPGLNPDRGAPQYVR